jgi:hypothetical protein
MAERNRVYVFKGPTEDEFREGLCSVVRQLRGLCVWDEHPDPRRSLLLTSHRNNVHALYVHWKEYEITSRVGENLDVPWIALRIQEGTLWDYSLYQGKSNLNNFSTLPEYWEDDGRFLTKWRGNAELLAKTWGIEEPTISAYLRSWYGGLDEDDCLILPPELTGKKAYPHDQSEYGDIWQMNDFLRALGAHDPNRGEPHSVSRLLVPAPE